MPPKAVAEVAVLASTAAALALAVLLVELLAEVLAAGAVVLVLEELLQPAARRMEPTAAAVATIALDARKINPPMLPPGYEGQALASWLDKW
jgi:hypothetical protein